VPDVKYQRVVNKKLDNAESGDTPAAELAGPCWPEDASLPRIVERNGEIVLDEAWVAVDDDQEPEPDAGL
jgi:hypothetical protein